MTVEISESNPVHAFILSALAAGERSDIDLCTEGEKFNLRTSEIRKGIKELHQQNRIWGDRPNNPIRWNLPPQ